MPPRLDSDLSWSDCLGSYTFPDGTKYEGEWRDNKPNGQGTFTESDNNQNMKTFTYPDGATYIGQYKNNKREGQGSITFACGDKYLGQWKDDKKYGQGTYIYSDGIKWVGGLKTINYMGKVFMYIQTV